VLGVVIRIGIDRIPELVGSAPPSSGEIVAALDDYVAAIDTHDLDRFSQTYDRTRPQFALCQQQLFEQAARTRERIVGPFMVGRIERWRDYVRAYADDGTGWYRLYFRREGDRWKLSEPLMSEIGDEHSKAFGATVVWTWDVDADLVDILGRAVEPVRQFAVAQGGPPPARPFEVRLAPLEALGPGCMFGGNAVTGYSLTTTITIRDLRLTPAYDHVSGDSLRLLEHEALHWIQSEFSRGAMQAMPWWMLEGWPTARAQPLVSRLVRRALCATPALTVTDLDRGPRRSDRPETVDREYTIASAMVEAMEAQLGPDVYWKLVDRFRTDANVGLVFATVGSSEAAVFDAVVAKTARC
jgi:hypothetical protein